MVDMKIGKLMPNVPIKNSITRIALMSGRRLGKFFLLGGAKVRSDSPGKPVFARGGAGPRI